MLTGKQIRSFLLLILKKVAMSLLVLGILFVGVFCWALTLYPFNFPYLLHLPEEPTNSVICTAFALTFLCIVTVTVRTKWCYDNDLFFSKEDNKLFSLMRRIVTSREWIADVIVFEMYVLAVAVGVAPVPMPWGAWIVGTTMIVVVSSLVFGLVDCLLYVIARKRADRRLRRRNENL